MNDRAMPRSKPQQPPPNPPQQQSVSARQLRNLSARQRALALRLIRDALRLAPRRRQELLGLTAPRRVGHESAGVFPQRERDRLERPAGGDPTEDQLGLKQREKPIRSRLAPALSRL